MAKTVLITGASGGLGEKFARLFAQRGYDLVLVARSREKMEVLAQELARRFGVVSYVLPVDLSDREQVLSIPRFTRANGIFVDVLINNAGFGDWGAFASRDADKQYRMVQVNIAALTELTHAYLQEMIPAGRGRILNVASIASFQPGPLMSVYYATKAIVLSCTEALSVELKNTGVKVSALCPGPTRTGFEDAAQLGRSGLFSNLHVASAEEVVRYGYQKLMEGKTVAVPGLLNKAAVLGAKFAPRALTRHVVYLIQK